MATSSIPVWNLTNENEKKPPKVSQETPFLPYKLYDGICKETDVPREVIEENNSELWYETLNGKGRVIFTNMKYFGYLRYGILDSRLFPDPNSSSSTSEIKETDSEIEFPDGTKYIGTIHNNVIEGTGTFIFPTGSEYSGGVKNGLRHGFGKFKCDEKNIFYEGEWENGLKHGKGTLTKPNMTYEGDWVNGVIHGFGKVKWSKTNNYYEGDLKETLWHGNGFMIWNDSKEKYYGQWSNNLQNGYGVHVWYEAKGELKLWRNRYVGEWRNGKRNGYGVFYYCNGSRYEGFWVDDCKEGFGIFSFWDRSQFVGMFWKDRMLTEIDLGTYHWEDHDTSSISTVNNMSNVPNTNNPGIAWTKEKENNKKSSNMFRKKAAATNDKPIPTNANVSNTAVLGALKEQLNNQNQNVIKNNVNVISANTNKKEDLVPLPSNFAPNGPNELDDNKRLIYNKENQIKIFIDVTDIVDLDPEFKSKLKEIDNILLRNLSDITHWYNFILGRDNAKDQDFASSWVTMTNENQQQKTISSFQPIVPAANNFNNFYNPSTIEDNVNKKASEGLTPDCVANNDLSYCLELKDIWKFVRDITGICNCEFTWAEFDRYFFKGGKNYYEMFYLPEHMNGNLVLVNGFENVWQDSDVYNLIYEKIEKNKNDFINLYSNCLPGNVKPEATINSKYRNSPEVQYKNIHNKRQIILIKHFYEIFIRVAYFKHVLSYPGESKIGTPRQSPPMNKRNAFNNLIGKTIKSSPSGKEFTFEDRLKTLLTTLKPIIKAKRKSMNVSKDNNNVSTISSHSGVNNDMKYRNLDLQWDVFMMQYEILLQPIFDEIFNISTVSPNYSDKTFTFGFFYDNILLPVRDKYLRKVILPKSNYCALVAGFTSKTNLNLNWNSSVNVNTSMLSISMSKRGEKGNAFGNMLGNVISSTLNCKEPKNTNTKNIYIIESEMIFYEFCELIFYLGKKIFALPQNKEKDEDFREIIGLVNRGIELAKNKQVKNKKEIKGRWNYSYPKVNAHIKIEEMKARIEREILEKKQKEVERARYDVERRAMDWNDHNAFKEEEEVSEEEDDEYY